MGIGKRLEQREGATDVGIDEHRELGCDHLRASILGSPPIKVGLHPLPWNLWQLSKHNVVEVTVTVPD